VLSVYPIWISAAIIVWFPAMKKSSGRVRLQRGCDPLPPETCTRPVAGGSASI
jgi:hypothetical protein